MKSWAFIISAVLTISSLALACSMSKTDNAAANTTPVNHADLLFGEFSADSAYKFIGEQVAFGPRVPGGDGHKACRQYLIDKFRSFGPDSMIIQDGQVTAFNGDVLPITNMVIGYNITSSRRILLVAHWDTRPWADKEKNPAKRNTPILGANDGGSGVGVLLEIARNLGKKAPNVGVDILLVDAEDYGDGSGFHNDEETWCLGTQYWIDNGMPPYHIDNLPVYGILLDMVGGKQARFHYEYYSQENAKMATVKIWSEAERLGYNNKFIRSDGGAITDDHVFITRAGIPTADIIETINVETSSFPPTWHTHNDNMKNISKSTLRAVGETVLNVVYKEKQY